ncbi:hypothetical protein NDU88_002195 [Pleurodeles waltl]|uniref:Uncharacterized protein n=1 Tax=Pleurodeles waltl TaxID=8319 RepID=A0AAV7S9L5_PLEWA|nr:hypothetical protein NDU88_002195 [Pleurodeles waltl]
MSCRVGPEGASLSGNMSWAKGLGAWELRLVPLFLASFPIDVRGLVPVLRSAKGDGDAGTSLGNPDIRVPYGPKREDKLHGRENTDVEADAEATGREEKEEHTEDEERKANNGDSRNGNCVVPTEAADQRETEENGDTRADRHAPGGMWLTKVRSFLKDSIL